MSVGVDGRDVGDCVGPCVGTADGNFVGGEEGDGDGCLGSTVKENVSQHPKLPFDS